MEPLDEVLSRTLAAIDEAPTRAALEEVRVAALGKKGEITALMKQLGGFDPEERRVRGQALNALKEEIASALNQRAEALGRAELDARIAAERVDVTLPPPPRPQGRIHPISQTVEELIAIGADLGFRVAEGPDVEGEWENFSALNMPASHPARQMHDTFYMPSAEDGSERVLRTHTSPVQIRTMIADEPPFRIMAPGRTYRSDSDATHSPMFHQIEGLWIDEGTHMGHLKGVLEALLSAFFGREVPIRLRPSFFPFTEPSAEVDVRCSRAGGRLVIGEGDDWMEILGCGMVHPNVLANCGIDPGRWQGFAFGMGIERMTMLKYGIPDIRSYFESDLRWLRHYGFSVLEAPNLALGLNR